MNIIRIVKKGKSDVTIQLDNDKNLILAVEVFLKSGLKKGDDISEDRFSLLIERNKLFHIKQKAFRLLTLRASSVFVWKAFVSPCRAPRTTRLIRSAGMNCWR